MESPIQLLENRIELIELRAFDMQCAALAAVVDSDINPSGSV
jgi:hypothetical protein